MQALRECSRKLVAKQASEHHPHCHPGAALASPPPRTRWWNRCRWGGEAPRAAGTCWKSGLTPNPNAVRTAHIPSGCSHGTESGWHPGIAAWRGSTVTGGAIRERTLPVCVHGLHEPGGEQDGLAGAWTAVSEPPQPHQVRMTLSPSRRGK